MISKRLLLGDEAIALGAIHAGISGVYAYPGTHQAALSMGFSRQEYWSGLPFPPPVDLPDPGIEPGSPTLQADSLPSELPGKPLLKPYCLLSTASWIHS